MTDVYLRWPALTAWTLRVTSHRNGRLAFYSIALRRERSGRLHLLHVQPMRINDDENAWQLEIMWFGDVRMDGPLPGDTHKRVASQRIARRTVLHRELNRSPRTAYVHASTWHLPSDRWDGKAWPMHKFRRVRSAYAGRRTLSWRLSHVPGDWQLNVTHQSCVDWNEKPRWWAGVR